MVTFATLPCALQLLLQRLTQVLTVVMISHMFLDLKGRDRPGSKDAESHGAWSRSRAKRPDPLETAISMETRDKKMSITLVGNLGNELMRVSMSDSWTASERAGK